VLHFSVTLLEHLLT